MYQSLIYSFHRLSSSSSNRNDSVWNYMNSVLTLVRTLYWPLQQAVHIKKWVNECIIRTVSTDSTLSSLRIVCKWRHHLGSTFWRCQTPQPWGTTTLEFEKYFFNLKFNILMDWELLLRASCWISINESRFMWSQLRFSATPLNKMHYVLLSDSWYDKNCSTKWSHWENSVIRHNWTLAVPGKI